MRSTIFSSLLLLWVFCGGLSGLSQVTEPTPSAVLQSKPAELPPPPPDLPTSWNREQRFDLNGDWVGFYFTRMFQIGIRIVQTGDTLTAEDLTSSFASTGEQFFHGSFDPKTLSGNVQLAEYAGIYTPGAVPTSWSASTIRIIDPDHIQIGDRPPFERASLPQVNDIACDVGNHYHVQAHWAEARGLVAARQRDNRTMGCWAYVAAVEGSAFGMANLGFELFRGVGVQKDEPMGFVWTKLSAEGGDASGALDLAALYKDGVGTAPDEAKSEYWFQKSKEFKLRDQEKASAERRQQAQQREGIQALGEMARDGMAALSQPTPTDPNEQSRQNAQNLATLGNDYAKVPDPSVKPAICNFQFNSRDQILEKQRILKERHAVCIDGHPVLESDHSVRLEIKIN